ncbi:hypothetical protein BJ912DRAFT_978400, partial [Pholiota molesta]
AASWWMQRQNGRRKDSRWIDGATSGCWREVCQTVVARFASATDGACSTSAYLYCMHVADDPVCEKSGEAPETVRHYLMECAGYHKERTVLQASLGGVRRVDEDVLGDKKHLSAVLRFIEDTGRFVDSHGSLAPASDSPSHD